MDKLILLFLPHIITKKQKQFPELHRETKAWWGFLFLLWKYKINQIYRVKYKMVRFTEGERKEINAIPTTFDWRRCRDPLVGAACNTCTNSAETWLNLLSSACGFHLGFSLFKQKLDKAATGFLGSTASHGNNRNYEAKHICTKHYKTHCWDSFKQLISCQCSPLCSPTCIETHWSEDIVNKGRAALSIHFPRLLLLPIPFLLFSTCLILTTHCCFCLLRDFVS